MLHEQDEVENMEMSKVQYKPLRLTNLVFVHLCILPFFDSFKSQQGKDGYRKALC